MARGSRTPDELEAKFRAEYLKLGNASEAARILGLPDRTGRDLGKRADEDPEFASLRRSMYAGALDEIEALMMGVARTAYVRHQGEVPEPPIPEGYRGTVVVKDERPAYGRLVVDAHRAALSRKKFATEREHANNGVGVKLQIEFTDGRAGEPAAGTEVPTEPGTEPKP